MVVGRPPWEYKPSAGAPIERYFGSIAEVTATFQAEEFELRSSGSLPSSPLDPWSPELLSLLRLWLIRGFTTPTGICYARKRAAAKK
uniref:Uncharacterized protein n=1 Tax=Globisporangium ultimum (strain ATCC 200006 / CBS 805.95 / DAOM BR144) TaxID=431595 RepID=K3W7E1_GLOUD